MLLFFELVLADFLHDGLHVGLTDPDGLILVLLAKFEQFLFLLLLLLEFSTAELLLYHEHGREASLLLAVSIFLRDFEPFLAGNLLQLLQLLLCILLLELLFDQELLVGPATLT